MKFDTEHNRFVVRYIALLAVQMLGCCVGITVHAKIRMHYDKNCTVTSQCTLWLC